MKDFTSTKKRNFLKIKPVKSKEKQISYLCKIIKKILKINENKIYLIFKILNF